MNGRCWRGSFCKCHDEIIILQETLVDQEHNPFSKTPYTSVLGLLQSLVKVYNYDFTTSACIEEYNASTEYGRATPQMSWRHRYCAESAPFHVIQRQHFIVFQSFQDVLLVSRFLKLPISIYLVYQVRERGLDRLHIALGQRSCQKLGQ